MLRSQIGIHGTDKYVHPMLILFICYGLVTALTDFASAPFVLLPFLLYSWTIIAAQFKDKTARQCRRR